MKFATKDRNLLIKAIVEAISENEDKVFRYVGNGGYILLLDDLKSVVRKALEAA